MRVELYGEGRRLEKRARFERRAGSLNEKRSGPTLRRRQSGHGDGNPFRTPVLRVVNIDV